MNRVARAIEIARTQIDPQKLADLEPKLAIDFGEHFAYQQWQAEAHVMGKLSTDEAQIVYAALGEVGSDSNGGWAKGTDAATKLAVTQLMAKFAKDKIAAR